MYGHSETGFIVWVIIFGIALVVDIFAALQFSTIAEMKGHKGSTYFWWTILTGPAGWIMVAALPDREEQQSQLSTQMPKLTATQTSETNPNEMPSLYTTELPKL